MGVGELVVALCAAVLLYCGVRFWQGDLGILNGMDDGMLSGMDDRARRQTGRILAVLMAAASLACILFAFGPKLAG